MRIFKIKRKSFFENRYHKNMGHLKSKVTVVKLYLFGLVPIKIIHKYRETYYGKIKDVKDCELSK